MDQPHLFCKPCFADRGFLLVNCVRSPARWFRIGPLNLQPSELAKIGIVLALAKLLEKPRETQGWKEIGRAFLLAAVPMGLILLQPDMGTSAVFIGLVFTMLFVKGQTRNI